MITYEFDGDGIEALHAVDDTLIAVAGWHCWRRVVKWSLNECLVSEFYFS